LQGDSSTKLRYKRTTGAAKLRAEYLVMKKKALSHISYSTARDLRRI